MQGMAHCITEKLKEDRCNNMICMQFTISPSILTGHWSRVLMWQVYTLWQRVSRHRGRGVSGNKDVLTQLYPLLPRYPRPFHFPSLRCLLRFVSFPLAPVWAHLAPPCGTRVLLTYSSPPRFWEIFAIPTFLGSFQQQTNEWQSSGIL